MNAEALLQRYCLLHMSTNLPVWVYVIYFACAHYVYTSLKRLYMGCRGFKTDVQNVKLEYDAYFTGAHLVLLSMA